MAQGVEKAAGVGVVITPDQIKATIGEHLDKVKPELVEKRYICSASTAAYMAGL